MPVCSHINYAHSPHGYRTDDGVEGCDGKEQCRRCRDWFPWGSLNDGMRCATCEREYAQDMQAFERSPVPTKREGRSSSGE